MKVRNDGRTLVAAALPAGEGDSNADLVEIDLETGEVAYLTQTPDVDERGPTLADDGAIVFRLGAVDDKSAGAIAVRDPSGEIRVLTGPDLVTGRPSMHVPTGMVIFSAAELVPQRQQFTVWVVSTSGTGLRLVSREPFRRVRWAPDGRSAAGLMTGGRHVGDIGRLDVTPSPSA